MIYLIHATVPLVKADGTRVYHYLGWCQEGHLIDRLLAHRTGRNGSKIARAFGRAGATLLLAALFPSGSRGEERRLKGWHRLSDLCPICNDRAQLVPLERPLPPARPLRSSRLRSERRGSESGGD